MAAAYFFKLPKAQWAQHANGVAKFEYILARSPFEHLTPANVLMRGPVVGKREARQLAKNHNATPWNF